MCSGSPYDSHICRQYKISSVCTQYNFTLTQGQNVITRYRECHILVLKSIQDPKAYGPQWTNKHVTRCLTEHRDEYKYNAEAVDILIKTHLVNLQQYDLHMAQVFDYNFIFRTTKFWHQL